MKQQPPSGNVVAIVQARVGSTRMPGKVLEPVLGRPLLAHLLERLSRAELVDQIVVASPTSKVNDAIQLVAENCGVGSFRGPELDVLSRYVGAARAFSADVVVRITADCPMIDPEVVDTAVATFLDSDLKFLGTGLSYPDGGDVEVFSMHSLLEADESARDNFDREHVTPFIKSSSRSRIRFIERGSAACSLRLTLDNPEDHEVISAVFNHFGGNVFSLDDVTKLAELEPGMFAPNRHFRRDEGSALSQGEKLWRRAKQVIPSGNMMVSKNPEVLFPGGGWPTYFSRAKGNRVWDLEGKRFFDFGLMGVGTNILGYGDEVVDAAVLEAVAAGNMSSLNAPEEVLLAEKLCELHPWANKVRFARTGGEACAMALRIARLASGKDGVAFSGYHGWHDWYLAANIGNPQALAGHHLPGISSAGVPAGLRGTSFPFEYNNIESLKALLADRGDIGTIFMEVQRDREPNEGFLEEIRELASAHGAVLIFDECTSGFRKVLGGLHLSLAVEPDMVVFGKTLGNGYALTAVVGRDEVMDSVDRTFLSSTFWTERIGSVAGLASLGRMEELSAPARVDAIGTRVRHAWRDLAESCGLHITIRGIPAISSFSVSGSSDQDLKQVIASRMLEEGILASNAFYASLAHEIPELDTYLNLLGDIFLTLANTLGHDRQADQ